MAMVVADASGSNANLAVLRATATPQPKKEKRRKVDTLAWIPTVATWVKIHLDRRVKRNQLTCNTPAVISKVNLDEGTVNVLFPNSLSVFFHDAGKRDTVLFSIETYPLSKVSVWDGPSKHLDKILIHALNFTEGKGHGVCGSSDLRVVPTEAHEQIRLDAKGTVVSSRSLAACGLKHNPQTPETDNKGELWTDNRRWVAGTPEKQLEENPRSEATADELRTFTAGLAELFRTSERDALAMSLIGEAMEKRFPRWCKMLETLDRQNKVFVCEDAVMQL